MSQLTPVQIAVVVVAVVSLVGVIITTIRKSAYYTGYEEYRNEIAKIASGLKAEMFRDGDDLVLTGNHKQYPIQIRFSYSETTPGLNIRMQAPVSFTFSVVPKGARATEGRVLVRTGDEMFDARFAARTDHPTQAKMLVTSKMMRTQMEKLCCSSKTFLTMTTGSIELSELIIPEPHTGRHVLDHVASMAALAAGVENIPGAENVKIKKYEKERSTPMLRIAIGIGAVTALCAVFVMKQAPEAAVLAESQPPFAGIFPVDERAIPAAMYWRTMKAEDFNPDVVGYLRNYGIPAEGRFLVNTDGDDRDDVVYFLTNEQGKRRVVLLQDGANVLDSVYEEMVGVVRIPHDSMQNLEWTQKPSEEAMGDALMIIRGSNVENFKAMILFPVNGRVVSGIPARYENISLK